MIPMDSIVRMIATDAPIKATAIGATQLVARAQQIHQSYPVATAALGRSLMAASILGDQLKGDKHSLTLRIQGGGPLGSIIVVSDSEGYVRGYVQNPQISLPSKAPGKLDVGRGVGQEGSLTVMKDLGLKDPYVGSVALVSGEIAEDLTAYYAESEQIPAAWALGVLVDTDGSVLVAGGYLIELLPGADDEVAARIEEGIKALGAVTPALQRGMSPTEVLEAVLCGFALERLEEHPVAYRCYCSRDRMAQALESLGPEELRAIIKEEGKAEIQCQFCDKKEHFDEAALEALLRQRESGNEG